MAKLRLHFPSNIQLAQELKSIVEIMIDRSLMMGRMFTPSALVNENGKRKLYVFDVGTNEKGIEAAHKHLKDHSKDIISYAISYDGTVKLDNKKCDAIIVEAGERNKESANIFVLAYEDNNFLFIKRIKPIGNLIFQGETTNDLN
jgi:hypothetical protein